MMPNTPIKDAMSYRPRQRAGIAPRLLRTLAILCIAAVGSVGASAGALVDQPYTVAYGDRLTTKVVIDGKGPFDFLLDSASSRTIIYERARAQLGLVPVNNEHVVVYGLNGVVNAPAVRPEEIRLSDERIRGLTIAALPDPGGTLDEPDGILGLDVLERYFVVLDQPEQRLRLFARASGAPEPYSAWPRVPMRPQRTKQFPFDLWYIDAKYTKVELAPVSATTLFDLGAGITIMNWEMAYRFRLRKWGLARSPAPQLVQDGLGKDAPVALLKGLWIEIGDRSWLNEPALITDPPVFELLDLTHRPAAIIGPGLLKNESLAIDFQNQYLYIAPKRKTD